MFYLTGGVGSEEGQARTVPENAARKRRSRELARQRGIPYTRALKILGWARQQLKQSYVNFGRPVGIITEPSLSGPHFSTAFGYGERLSHLWLRYGDRSGPPDAFIGTHHPLPGDEPDTGLLVEGLHNLILQHERYSSDGAPSGLDPDERHNLTLRVQHAVKTAPREAAEARFHHGRWPCVRVRVGGFEALEIPYGDGSIVYCGLASLSDTVRFGLEGAA